MAFIIAAKINATPTAVSAGLWGQKATKGHKNHRGSKGILAAQGRKAILATRGLWGLREFLARKAQGGQGEILAQLDPLETLAQEEILAQGAMQAHKGFQASKECAAISARKVTLDVKGRKAISAQSGQLGLLGLLDRPVRKGILGHKGQGAFQGHKGLLGLLALWVPKESLAHKAFKGQPGQLGHKAQKAAQEMRGQLGLLAQPGLLVRLALPGQGQLSHLRQGFQSL